MLLAIICVVNGRWRHKKKNTILHTKLNWNLTSRPAKKSTLKQRDKPKISFFLVHNCTADTKECKITNEKPDSAETQNATDQSDKGNLFDILLTFYVFNVPSLIDVPLWRKKIY